jgi:hypothetical protein
MITPTETPSCGSTKSAASDLFDLTPKTIPRCLKTDSHDIWVYPRGMVGKPSEPSPPDSLQQAAAQESGQFDQSDQVTGPLAVERLRKSDGRALILYTLHPHVEHTS